VTAEEQHRGARVGQALATAFVAVGFFLLALVGLGLSRSHGEVAALWPATAFAVVTLWRRPDVDVASALLAIACAAFAAIATMGSEFELAAALAIVDATEVWLALVGLRWFGERRLDRSILVFLGALIIVGIAAPVVGASLGAAVVSRATGADFISVWQTWWVGNAFGAALVMPVAASATRARLRAIWNDRALVEATGLAIAAALAVAATVTRIGQPNLLMAVPVMIAAIRLNPLAAGALGSATVVSVIGVALVGAPLATPGAIAGTIFGPWSSATVLLPYCISLLIDELGREREKIAASERHFRHVMDRSPFGMALLDVRGRCYAVNRTLCEFLGYEPSDLIGLTPADITHGDDREQVAPRMRRLLAGEADDYALEKQFLHKDGRPIWTYIAVSMVRDERSGSPLYMIAQMQDISARKAAEAALEESESRWNFALESAGQGVWDYDYSERATFYSPMWARMLGYEPDEVSTEADAWLALVHPGDLSRLLHQEQLHLAGETDQFECEFRMRHKDGHWLWILDRGKVIARDADGSPLRMVGTHTDITEYRVLTEALEEEKERLRITLHSIGDGVVCTDAGGLVTFMNPIAEQLTGWSAATALNRPVDLVFRLIAEEGEVSVDSPVARCLSRLDRVSHDEGVLLDRKSVV
jgi:PAS domain S-box-containing protein